VIDQIDAELNAAGPGVPGGGAGAGDVPHHVPLTSSASSHAVVEAKAASGGGHGHGGAVVPGSGHGHAGAGTEHAMIGIFPSRLGLSAD
jgi:hypothetical protein